MEEKIFDINSLPDGFLQRMRAFLGNEYESFLNSYKKPYKRALRINNLKTSPEKMLSAPGFKTEAPVSWNSLGFYFEDDVHPGKSPYHEAGLYYLQEPSAMLVAELTGTKPGERVLDLCAAPGGKATAIAGMLGEAGLLVANEIHPARAKILSQNIERMGIKNAFVTNESPASLSAKFPLFFDKIIVDAPCSGEGMFRKESAAIECWSTENINLCVARQREIIDEAVKMLRPGGKLFYSTCTFAPEEDEENVMAFLSAHDDLRLYCFSSLPDGCSHGLKLDTIPPEISGNVIRIWPHKANGEGHFFAAFEKKGEDSSSLHPVIKQKPPKVNPLAVKLWEEFKKNLLNASALKNDNGVLLSYGNNLYFEPFNIDLSGIKCLRPGLQLGEINKDRFEPSFALALALNENDVISSVPVDLNTAGKVIAGESIPCDPALKGWQLITLQGTGLAFGKASNGQLKNHYPKGIRRQLFKT